MKNNNGNVTQDIILIACSFILGFCVALNINRASWKNEAVKMGVGRFNSTNAQFEWVTNRVDK